MAVYQFATSRDHIVGLSFFLQAGGSQELSVTLKPNERFFVKRIGIGGCLPDGCLISMGASGREMIREACSIHFYGKRIEFHAVSLPEDPLIVTMRNQTITQQAPVVTLFGKLGSTK